MMRNLRKLLLLTVMAVAAAAVVAPTAFGQNLENHETLEVLKEPALGHCPAVTKPTPHTTAGGCLIHAKSTTEVELRKHVFGIESHIARCENEFSGRLNEDGEGYVIHQKLIPHPDGLCDRQPCIEPFPETEPTPWPAHGDEGHVPGVDGETGVPAGEYLIVNFCVEPVGGGGDETCEVSVPFNTVGGVGHDYEVGDGVEIPGHGTSGFRCEVIGHWQTEAVNGTLEDEPGGEAETKIEIRHLANENKAEAP
jgi:hypothetical protein